MFGMAKMGIMVKFGQKKSPPTEIDGDKPTVYFEVLAMICANWSFTPA